MPGKRWACLNDLCIGGLQGLQGLAVYATAGLLLAGFGAHTEGEGREEITRMVIILSEIFEEDCR